MHRANMNFVQEVYIEPVCWNALSFARFIILRLRNTAQALTLLIRNRDDKFIIVAGTRIEQICVHMLSYRLSEDVALWAVNTPILLS